MSWKSLATSLSSREEVGSSRISTLQFMSTARAMATICCTAREQEDNSCFGRAGMPRLFRIAAAFFS